MKRQNKEQHDQIISLNAVRIFMLMVENLEDHRVREQVHGGRGPQIAKSVVVVGTKGSIRVVGVSREGERRLGQASEGRCAVEAVVAAHAPLFIDYQW